MKRRGAEGHIFPLKWISATINSYYFRSKKYVHFTSTTCAFNINPHKRLIQTHKTGQNGGSSGECWETPHNPKISLPHDEEKSVELQRLLVREGKRFGLVSDTVWKDRQGKEREKSAEMWAKQDLQITFSISLANSQHQITEIFLLRVKC